MDRTTSPRWLSGCLLLLAALSPHSILAQQPSIGAGTVLPPPSDEPIPAPAPGPSIALPNPGPFVAPPEPAPSSAANLWGLLSDCPDMPQHFFVDKEVDILKPHLKAALVGSVEMSNGIMDSVHPPTAQLNWSSAPRIEAGWFLPPGLGYFALSYRGLADDGRQTVSGLDDIPYALRTRLDLNEVSFDYGTAPYSFAPRWFVSGRLGMAAAAVFFDNQANNAVQGLDASNYYYGAGPHFRLDLWREFNLFPGLSLFAQPDFMVLVGRVQQHYRESVVEDGSTINGSFFLRRTQTVPVFTVRTGLSYTPASLSQCRFMVGYEFEDWWNVGQVPGQPSRGEFYTNGVFLRALVNF